MPDLRVGDILRDHDILEDAREEAFRAADRMREGREPGRRELVTPLERRWAGRRGIVQVG